MRIVTRPTVGRTAVILIGLIFVWLAFHVDFQTRRPKHPDVSTGQVIPMTGTHGRYYISSTDRLLLNFFELAMLAAVAPIVFATVGKALSKNKKS